MHKQASKSVAKHS